ncbi:MAG: hypothetical protein P4N59_03645 [Negativicutes bacterium]|nr:hypothetical protein [Negativicutes bacterium]
MSDKCSVCGQIVGGIVDGKCKLCRQFPPNFVSYSDGFPPQKSVGAWADMVQISRMELQSLCQQIAEEQGREVKYRRVIDKCMKAFNVLVEFNILPGMEYDKTAIELANECKDALSNTTASPVMDVVRAARAIDDAIGSMGTKGGRPDYGVMITMDLAQNLRDALRRMKG